LREGASDDTRAGEKRSASIPRTFLSTIDGVENCNVFQKADDFFQGDSSDAVFYIQNGKVKLTVVSKTGKEATIGILNEGDFFGEGCLMANLPPGITAMTDCSVMRIEKKAMRECFTGSTRFPTCSWHIC
jgi:CRP-like cAMP-binding protein